MKNILLFFFAGIFLLLSGCNEPDAPANNSNNPVNKHLLELLDQKEYFRLETQLNLFKDSLDDKQRLFFQAFIDNAFNRNEESIKNIQTLLNKYSPTITDSMKAAVILLQDDDYFKLYQYAKAAQSISTVLSNYAGSLDSEKISDVKNDLLIRNALQNIPPQETIMRDNTVVHWKQDKLGLIEIPVKSNSKTHDCIFDTRANISSISQTYAAKLVLKMLEVSY
jgi:hypothetical protein